LCQDGQVIDWPRLPCQGTSHLGFEQPHKQGWLRRVDGGRCDQHTWHVGDQILHVRNSPPFTWIVWPVMKVPSGPTRSRTMAAISSTDPKRFKGIGRLRRLAGRAPAEVPRVVSMAPGATALQVML